MDSEINMHYANELRAHLESIVRAYDNIVRGNLQGADGEFDGSLNLQANINQARSLLAILTASRRIIVMREIELLVGESVLIGTPNGYIRIEASARFETDDSKTMLGRTIISIVAYPPQNRLIYRPSASLPEAFSGIEIVEETHE